jgi:7,8-dihydroneopterin aldolase/epimerase/oxygenase
VVEDRILLSGVELFAHGGVTAEERQIGQRYRLDLELRLPLSPAGSSDDPHDTVSYAEVHDVAVASVRERPFNLIESAAQRIAEVLLSRFPIDGVTVRLTKLAPPVDGIVAGAAVEIVRQRGG